MQNLEQGKTLKGVQERMGTIYNTLPSGGGVHIGGKRVHEPQSLAKKQQHIPTSPSLSSSLPRHLLAFAETYPGLEEHRAGQGGVLRYLLGRDLEEDAGSPQKCHPGDLTDPRALKPGEKGTRVRPGYGHGPSPHSRASTRLTWGSVGTGAASESLASLLSSASSST